MQTFTNDDLLENIRLRAMMPTSQATYTSTRLLMLGNDELQTVIFPMIMSTKGDYFVHTNTQTMTDTLEYPIPGDAVGIKIKSAYLRDPNWSDNQPSQLIPQINYQDYTNQGAGCFNSLSCYVMGNSLFLTHTKQGQNLEMKYYKRAYKLVENAEGAQITAVASGVITVSLVPTGWAVGDTLMLTSQDPPFETITTTLEITDITGSEITLVQNDPTGDLPLSTDIGNWLTQEGETVIAQITPEAHPILSQSVAIKCLEGLNDPGLLVGQSKFQQLYTAFINTMTPRVDGQAKKIIQRNGTLKWNKVSR